MTPADGTFFAHFGYSSQSQFDVPGSPREVIAWADNGDALLLGKNGLVAAHTLDGFQYIRRARVKSKVVAALPGGGWKITTKFTDGETWTTPVLAWLVHEDGDVVPVDISPDGSAGNAVIADDETAQEVAVYHPDHPTTSHREADPAA
ncbi:hypothetical protein ACWDPF_33595 [Streptomyces albogriseolus]